MKTMVPSIQRPVASATVVLITAMLIASAMSTKAANLYWDFGGTPATTWTTLANWDTAADGAGGDPLAAPGASDTAYFNVSGTNSPQIASFGSALSVGGLVFNNTSTTAINSTANLAITLGAGGLVVNSGAGAVTFGTITSGQRVTFTLGASQVWSNSSSALVFNNNNTIALGANTLTIDGSGDITTGSGAISGTGGITKQGGNTFTLGGSETFTGGLIVKAGMVTSSSINVGAFGLGTITLGDGIASGGSNATLQATGVNTAMTNNITVAANSSGNLTIQGQTASSMTFGGTVTLNSPLTVDALAGATKTVTFSNVISGSSALTKGAGVGVVILTGANSYNGTVISGGSLRVTNSGTLGSTSGALTANGGTLDLGATSQTVGAVTISGGTIANGTLNGASYAGQSGTVSAILTGSGIGLTKTTGGTLTLATNNTFTGGVTVNAGTVSVTAGAAATTNTALGTGTLTLNNGTALSLGNRIITNSVVIGSGSATIDGNATLRGSISGGGNLIHGGGAAFKLTLFADNSSYSGNVTNSATLALGAKTALGTGTLFMTNATDGSGNSSLGANANLTGANAVTNGIVLLADGQLGANNSINDFELSGIISGSYGVKINHASPTVTLSGANTYWGETVFTSAGKLVVGHQLALQNSTLNYTNGTATFATGITSFTLGGLAGNKDLGLTNASGLAVALTVGNNGSNTTYSAALSDTGSLTKMGAGILTLSGTNTYAGNTIIHGGVLALSGSGSISNTPLISIASGGLFDSGSAFVLGSSQTLSNSASGTGAMGGNLNASAGTVAVSYNGSPSLMVTNGTLTLAGGTTFRINNTGAALGAGSYKIISTNLAGVVSGTPSSVTVGGSGISGTSASLSNINGELYLVVVGGSGASATTTTAGTSGSPSVYGDSVTFTATLLTNGVTASDATSSYVFKVDGTPVATNAVSGGQANYLTSTLAAGAHTITAEYLGDVNYLPSTNTVSQTVNKQTPVASMAMSATGIIYGQSLASSTPSGAFTNAVGASVGGSFAFVNTGITPAHVGITNVAAVFTPSSANYNNVTNTVSVLVGPVNTTTNITFSAGIGSLTLNWPESHKGWMVQSNAVDLANPGDWHNINSSTNGTSLVITVDSSSPNVFYRLRNP